MRKEIKFVGFYLVIWSCGQNEKKPLIKEGIFISRADQMPF